MVVGGPLNIDVILREQSRDCIASVLELSRSLSYPSLKELRAFRKSLYTPLSESRLIYRGKADGIFINQRAEALKALSRNDCRAGTRRDHRRFEGTDRRETIVHMNPCTWTWHGKAGKVGGFLSRCRWLPR